MGIVTLNQYLLIKTTQIGQAQERAPRAKEHTIGKK
jgi:hypothetical protein